MNRLTSRLPLTTAILCLMSLPISPCGLAQETPVHNKLFITILEGEGALNDIRGRTAREPIIQVEDENHKPVAGAAVIFTTPGSGASATFSNGLTSLHTTTTADGKAFATGMRPNSTTGEYQIQVQANWASLSSVAVINTVNVLESSHSSRAQHAGRGFPVKIVVIGAVIVGGVAAGILASRGQQPDSLTPGAPVVGAPSVKTAPILSIR